MSDEIPRDYDAEYSTQENGLDCCARCDETLKFGISGWVWDSDGNKYPDIMDTDPANGPFFCRDCWNELEANRKAAENQALRDFDNE